MISVYLLKIRSVVRVRGDSGEEVDRPAQQFDDGGELRRRRWQHVPSDGESNSTINGRGELSKGGAEYCC